MPTPPKPKPKTRIQREKQDIILDAALNVFSLHGFRGATIDQIADGEQPVASRIKNDLAQQIAQCVDATVQVADDEVAAGRVRGMPANDRIGLVSRVHIGNHSLGPRLQRPAASSHHPPRGDTWRYVATGSDASRKCRRGKHSTARGASPRAAL